MAGFHRKSRILRNSDGNVKIGHKFMDRKRHPLQSRQLGGNTNNGKKDDNGRKDDKIGTDGRTGTNEYRHPDPTRHFAKEAHVALGRKAV